MKKLFLTLFLALTAIAMNAQAVTLNFKFGGEVVENAGWSNSYGNHTVDRDADDFTLTFTNFSKQTSTVSDCPVTKAGNLVLALRNGATFSSVKFTLKQWGTKAKTASLQYSTDGTNFSAFNPAITSSNFSIEATDIPAGTVAIKLDLSADSSNQVGVFEVEYTVVGKEETRTPVTISFGDVTDGTITLGDNFTLPALNVDPAAVKALVTYSSDNEAVATIDAATGVVTVVGAGTTVFTASFGGNDTYAPAAPATFTLKVEPLLAGNELYIEFSKGTNKDGGTLNASANPSTFISVGETNVIGFTGTNTQVYGSSTGGIKLASGKNAGSFTLKLAKSYRITGITVNAAAYGSDVATVSVNGETFTPSGSALQDYQLTYTLTAPTDEISISANKRAYIGALTIYYETGDEGDYVEAPQFSVEGGSVEKGTKVELTCETEGAAIYYTLDGTTPTTESTLYTAPITINETTTVSAIAVKEGMENSPVNKATYTVVKSYTSLADFIADAPQTNTIIDVPVTVFYYSRPYLYVTDGTTNTFLYSDSFRDEGYKNGDVIPAGFAGTYNTKYNEIVPDVATLREPAEGTPIEPTVVAEVSEVKVDDYVKFENVTINSISGTENKNATATLADGSTLSLFNRFGVANFAVGEGLTIVGIGSIYNSAVQIYPTEIIEPAPTEVAALTITPEFGTIYTGQEIVIDCETEGALLTGYIGNIEIDGEAMPYTYTVNEAVGTKIEVAVYGHKAGLTDTEELEGEFTVAERPSLVNSEATFDWADIASLRTFLPEDKRNELINATKLSSYIFTNKVVELTFAKGTNKSNEPTYYDTDNTLRIYADNTMTVRLNSNVGHIDGITFTCDPKYAGLALADGQAGTFTSENGTAVWTAAESRADNAVSEVTFTASANSRIKTIKVAYTDVPTGIEAVEAAESDAPAVFYNLQGIRVNNPSNGIFIRVQGNNVDKVLVK